MDYDDAKLDGGTLEFSKLREVVEVGARFDWQFPLSQRIALANTRN